VADNRLVAGSSPPGPTTQSCANPEFPVSAEHPEFSFILSGLGAHLKLIPEEGRDLILAGALLSDDLPAPLQPG
jgi:hypothetical protein